MADNRGNSETIGVVLLTAVAVVTVSIAAGAVFLADSPVDRPQATIDASVDGSNLTVEHAGGEPLDSDSVLITISGSQAEFAPADAIDGRFDADELFEPGESVTFQLDAGETPTAVSLVYQDEQRLLLDTEYLSTGTTVEPGTSTETTTVTTTAEPTTVTTTTAEPVDVDIRVTDISNAHEVRFQIDWAVDGDYDEVVFELYRYDDGDWELVDTERPGLLERWFGLPTRVTDEDQNAGTYRVVMTVDVGDETSVQQVDKEVQGPGDGGEGGDDDDWWDWWPPW